MPCVKSGERPGVQVAQIGERLSEEARVQQAQDRAPDAADVLVDGIERASTSASRRLVVAGVRVAHEVRGRVVVHRERWRRML